MKILIMPLFKFPTGHTKTAETMRDSIARQYPDAMIEEVEFLSYCHPCLEKFVGASYMKWIRMAPSFYGKVYQKLMGKSMTKRWKIKFTLASFYFERKMKGLIEKEQPNLVVCTHSFPSKVLGELIVKHAIKDTAVVNVYTDLFINGVWAKKGITYHLVPHTTAKETLMRDYNIPAENIYVTGIPIHPAFQCMEKTAEHEKVHVLVAGGNTGLIHIEELLKLVTSQPNVQFTILCGKNEVLYNTLSGHQLPFVRLKKYIEKPEEMNALYNEVDAVITKPGGVTVSEVIKKKIPLFISHYLPGPEEENVTFLLESGMAHKLSLSTYHPKEAEALCSEYALREMMENMAAYNRDITCTVSEAVKEIVQKERQIEEENNRQKVENLRTNERVLIKSISS